MKHLTTKYNIFSTTESISTEILPTDYNEPFNNICDCFRDISDKMNIHISYIEDNKIAVEISSGKYEDRFFRISNEIFETIKFSINYLKGICEFESIRKVHYNRQLDKRILIPVNIYFKTKADMYSFKRSQNSLNYLNVKMIDEFFSETNSNEMISDIKLIFKY